MIKWEYLELRWHTLDSSPWLDPPLGIGSELAKHLSASLLQMQVSVHEQGHIDIKRSSRVKARFRHVDVLNALGRLGWEVVAAEWSRRPLEADCILRRPAEG